MIMKREANAKRKLFFKILNKGNLIFLKLIESGCTSKRN
jgi:hypothetical protein